MKKRILTIVVAVMTIVVIFGFAGCTNKEKENENLKDKDLFAEVFEKWYTSDGDDLTSYVYEYGSAIYQWTGKSEPIADINVLTHAGLPMKNWESFRFAFKTDKYRITKVEFDVQVEQECTLIFALAVSYLNGASYGGRQAEGEQYKFHIAQGQIQHVVFKNLSLTAKQKQMYILNSPKNVMEKSQYKKLGGYTTPWTLNNLKVTGELA